MPDEELEDAHPSTLTDPGKKIGFQVGDRTVDGWGREFSEDAEEAEDDEEAGPYDAWTVPQLKQELTNRELKTTGKAAALRARLEENDDTADEEEEGGEE